MPSDTYLALSIVNRTGTIGENVRAKILIIIKRSTVSPVGCRQRTVALNGVLGRQRGHRKVIRVMRRFGAAVASLVASVKLLDVESG